MIILVINSGSSSIKFQLLETETRDVLCRGLIERLGLADSIFNYQPGKGEKLKRTLNIPDHQTGIRIVLDTLTDPEIGVLSDIKDITAVGHRIVHGGEKIKKSELLTPEILAIIEECSNLAPLHNPANLMGVSAIKKLLPKVPNVGVFDTAFHASMPPSAFVYPLNYRFYDEYGIRRFGFHGTSHQYVSMRAAELLGMKAKQFNCVTCHLGNGVSISAIKGGKSVDTSLGFGTVCGVPMGTRSGDVDPAVILHLIDKLGMSAAEVHELVYKESGFLGISGISSDMRDVEDAAAKGNSRARLALEIFSHHARKYIAAMATSLEGRMDALIFTAGVGENGPEARQDICKGLEFMGVRLDKSKNNIRGREAIISLEESPVKIVVVPTNEELMIAMDTDKIVREFHHI